MLEFSIGKIVQWIKEEGKSASWKGYRTFFSPELGIAVWLILQTVLESGGSDSKGYIYACLSSSSLVISYLISIVVSNFLVCSLLKVPLLDKLFIKHSAYEKREDEYYLKKGNILKRKYFNFIDRYGEMIFLILVDLLGKSLIAINMDPQPWISCMNTSEAVLVWWIFKANYLAGKTWDEMQASGRTGQDSRNPIEKKIWNSVSSKMTNALGCFFEYTSSFYTESDEKKAFSDKYKELFLNLKNDKSVYITNCFYQDWERAVFIPIHRFLLNDRKVIILAGRSMDEKALVKWTNSELESMIGSFDSWHVKIWERGSEKWDIAVVRYEDIPYFAREFGEYESFKGAFVLVLEPSCMLLEIRPYLEMMADRLKNMEKEPVYCLADREMTGLLDTFSHIFRTTVEGISIDFSKCANIRYYGIDNTVKMDAQKYWGTRDYWSNGAVIAAEFLKEGGSVTYCSGAVSAVWDVRDSLKGKILNPVFSQEDQKKIIERFDKSSFISSFWEIKRQESCHIIVDDDNRNFYELCNLMVGRGREWEDIFVISEEYVLREYMWQLAAKQMFVKDAIPVYFPIYEDTERNKVLRLLYRGYDGEIPLEFVKGILDENSTGDALKVKVNKLISKYFFSKAYMEAVTVKNNKSLVLSEGFLRSNQWWLEDVYFVDEENKDKEYGCRKMGQISPFYLAGQYIVLDGRYYMIQGFERLHGRKLMLLKRSSSLNQQGSYYQRRIYKIIDTYKYGHERIFTDSHIEMKVLAGDIEVETVELVEIKSWNCFSPEQEENEKQHLSGRNMPQRRYKNKKLLHLSLCKNSPLLPEEKADAYQGFGVLLTEFAKTIFPYHHPYLAVLPVNQSEGSLEIRHLYHLEQKQKEKKRYKDGVLILEDSVEDIGILETIIQHFPRIMSLCYDYCKWGREGSICYMETPKWTNMIEHILLIWEKKESESNDNRAAEESAATSAEMKGEGTGEKPEEGSEGKSEEESESEASKAVKETAGTLDARVDGETIADVNNGRDIYMNDYGKWYCAACGTELTGKSIFGMRKYCEDCRERENPLQDYKNSFDRMAKWMEDHMGIHIGGMPRIVIRWFGGRSRLGFRKPVALTGKKRVSCREGMKKECVDIHMIHVCVEVWICRNRKKLNRSKRKGLERYSKEIPCWFQVQYLYLVQSEDAARDFERRTDVAQKESWEKLKVRCPFVQVQNLSKNDVKKLYENNPIAVFGR